MPCVVLVGAPGSGKSTVGRRVASAIGTRYLDTDEIVARTAGMTVADIFVNAGEPTFRKMEEEAVQEALQASGSVVSLGGGAIISEVTRQRLSGHRVVWLRVSVADAAARVGMGVARPLLVGNVRSRLAVLMREREDWYEQVCSTSVETSDRPIEHVVSDVLAFVHQGVSA